MPFNFLFHSPPLEMSMDLISNNLRKQACFQHFLSFLWNMMTASHDQKKIGVIKLKIVWKKEEPDMNEVISCFCGTVA